MAKKQSNVNTFKVTGIVDYARVHTPTTKYGKDGSDNLKDQEYMVSIRITPELKKELLTHFLDNGVSAEVFNPKTKKMQSRFKTGQDGVERLTLTRDAINSQGKETTITVVDAMNEAIPKSTLIGNGSLAEVEILTYKVQDEGVIRLSGLQVLNLIPVGGSAGSRFSAKPEYAQSSSSNSSDDSLAANPF